MPPLALIVAAWLAGLIAARYGLVPFGVEPVSLAILSIVPLAAILLWRRDHSIRLSGFCALFLLLGALRYQIALPNLEDPGFVAHYNDRGWVTLEGIVHGYPDVRDTWTNLRLETESIGLDGEANPVGGTVLVRAPRFPEYRYGDRLRVSGLLQTPPELEGFSYQEYLARQSVYSFVNRPEIVKVASGQASPFWAALYAVKDRAREAIARLVPDPEASLLQGILLGIRSGIPADLYDDYNATGTSHIIVISGSNIAFVSALFALTFGRILGKRRAYWFTLAGIAFYVLLVGAEAAVVRAGLMGGLLITALYLGRRSTAYVALFASAFVLTALQPTALWDVSFQLSFAATLSLILFAPALERVFERGLEGATASAGVASEGQVRPALRFLNDALILTLAAQVLTLPLVVYHFGRLSLVAPLANLLILPVQPPIMALGGAATLLALVPFLEPLARVLAWVPWLCLAYCDAVVRRLAGWRFAVLEIDRTDAGWLVLGWLALLAAAWAWKRRRGIGQHLRAMRTGGRSTALLLGGMLVIVILAWLAVLQLPDGRLHVAFLDVGQGDAVLVTTPRGQQVLIDGGPSPSALTTALGREMPFWDRSLDLVVMTHPDADHITGLVAALDRYRVAGWLDNGQATEDTLYAECLARLEAAQVPRLTFHAGDRLDLGEGIALEVLHPPAEPVTGTKADDNNNSLVLRLAWEDAGFLLTGDLEAEAEHLLLASGQPLPAGVLKVAHHGSGGSSTAEFLAAVDPAYAVLSVGADNRFGHPNPGVLERLDGLGQVTILRTDQKGTIEFVTDGQRLWVRTEQ